MICRRGREGEDVDVFPSRGRRGEFREIAQKFSARKLNRR
jgi:hypothetical protein